MTVAINSTYRHCMESASAAAGRQLDENELINSFQRLQGRMLKLVAEGMTEKEAATAAGMQLGVEHKAAAAVQRRVELMNLQKRVAQRQRLDEYANAFKTKGEVRPDRALDAAINGSTDPRITGGRLSTEAGWVQGKKEYLTGIEHELKDAGLVKAARSGVLDEAIYKEMYALTERGKAQGNTPGWSGSAQAKQVAAIYSKYYGLARERLNKQGAWIGELDDFVMHNSHDPNKIYKTKVEDWSKFTLDRLDYGRTLEEAVLGGETAEGFLKSVWGGLATGVHLSDAGGVGFKAPAFSGPGNLAKRLSEGRVLHWKDAQSGFEYMKRFGRNGTLTEQLISAMDRAARQEALLRDWGTNPRAELDNTIRWFQEKYRDSDPAAVRRLDGAKTKIQQWFGRVDGSANVPVNEMLATFGRGARAVQVTSKLGAVLLSDLGNTVFAARELQRQGENFFASYGNALASWAGPLQGKAARENLDVVGAFIEGAHTHLMANAWVNDGTPGFISTVQNKFMSLTGTPYGLKWKQAGVAGGLARIVGRQVGKDFDALLPETQRAFNQFGISPAEWNLIRSAPDMFKNSAGHELMLPDAVARVAGGETAARKLAAYYSETADRATIQPKISDREIVLRGTRPGTLEGELARFVLQFKSWPIAMWRQTVDAEFNSGAGTKDATLGAIQLMVGLTAFGYMRMALKAMSLGQEPPGWSPANAVAAMAQGGAGGIYGDLLFGGQNRMGQGLLETLAGPIVGETTNTIMTVWNNVRDYATGQKKDLKELGPEMVRLGMQNTPFVNLFYTRAALNYLFIYSLQESMNPGFLQRAQKNLRERTGQSYVAPSTPGVGWMNPQQHLRPFGR